MRIQSFLLASLVAVASIASAQDRPSQPEPPSGWNAKKLAHAKRYMVAAANPLAVDAGVRMLERGGSAVDAMIATQLVLNLVEPSSSGLGGGAFLLFYDAKAKAIRAIDARETAPAGATPALFTKPDGTPMAFLDARVGGRSVGTPGTPRLLEVAHARYGKLPWATLFEPAIELAEKGFPVSPRFNRLIGEDAGLANEPVARAYFFDDAGKPRAVGTIVRNPAFGATFTYYLKEAPKTKKQKRQDAEKEAERKGTPLPYPALADLSAEEEEEAPGIIFTIAVIYLIRGGILLWLGA
jgi:gamma-glutamyltranspeptidase/glutathione hydrolase